MLFDLHAHSSGISVCCRIPGEKVVEEAAAAGLDGIVLTNHYQHSYLREEDGQEFVTRYLDEYEKTRIAGEKRGIKVFFGIEVTMDFASNVHLLLYGLGEAFLREFPLLFTYSHEELYRLVRVHGGTLIQAHPFRNGSRILDTRFLDGLEVNCHPLYRNSYKDELEKAATEAGLILTAGGDYHADTYRPLCGTYLPQSVTDEAALARYLKETAAITLRIHEPNTPAPFDFVYQREP